MNAAWMRYIRHRRVEDRNALVVHYAHLAEAHADRLARRLPRQIGQDELRSAAFDGLLQAVESFDPSRSARFETFCQRRITGAVMDWLRTQDQQSRSVRTFERRRAQVREMFNHDVGRPPTDRELASRMGLPAGRFRSLSRLSQAGSRVHFSAMEAQVSSRHPGAPRAWDIQDRRAADPAQTVMRTMLTDFLARGLTRDERLVLVLYYYEELTMAEIGGILDLSESRVSQIHKDVLERLRQRCRARLREELAV